MKKIIILMLSLSMFLTAKADSLEGIQLSATEAQSYPDTLLYKITGPNIQDSYLFGTLHLLPKEKLFIPEKVSKALRSVDKLVMELDMDNPVELTKMMTMSLLPNGEHVYDYMSEEQWQKVQKSWYEIYGENSLKFSRMKPFLLISFLLKKYLGKEPGSYEIALMELAHQNGMQIEGLESVEEQMGMIDNLGVKKQVDMLMQFIDDEQAMAKDLKAMTQKYLNEDINALNVMMQRYYNEDPEMLKSMLDARNKKWVPIIEAMAVNQSALFAFGAGHLAGKNGMLNLLKQAGYDVIPVEK